MGASIPLALKLTRKMTKTYLTSRKRPAFLFCCIILSFASLARVFPSSPKQIARVAFVHELLPKTDQGGNIRVQRFIDSLQKSGFVVDFYARAKVRKGLYNFGRARRVPVFPVDSDLRELRGNLGKYQIIFSGMWFWRSNTETIPELISRELFLRGGEQLHVIVTDDIHHIRCAKVGMKYHLSETCAQIAHAERRIWEDPFSMKIFVSEGDAEFALKSSYMLRSSAIVLPYLLSQSQLAPTSKFSFFESRKCEFVYFGAAHEANVQALQAMISGAVDTLVEFHSHNKAKNNCKLHVLGDDRWKSMISQMDISDLNDLGIRLYTDGFANDLPTALRRMAFAILPVTVGGTGISTKILTCIELGVPFISTHEGNQGFPCDRECEELFFRSSVKDVLGESLKAFRDDDHLRRAFRKLKEIRDSFQTIDMRNIFMPMLEENTLLASQTALTRRLYLPHTGHLRNECKECAENVDCRNTCSLSRGDVCQATAFELSVYVSVRGTSSELSFLEGYVQDVLDQDFPYPWELVFASTDIQALRLFRELFQQDSRPNSLCIRLVHMRVDRGLYETWDYLIEHHTMSSNLMNWNIDDRKHKYALRMKHKVLTEADVALVSSAVHVSSTPNENFAARVQHRHRNIWFHDFTGTYGLLSMLQDNNGHLTSMNLPHNSPMYKRRLHTDYGRFSAPWHQKPIKQGTAPACSDFRFWLQPLRVGERYFHIRLPMEVYYIRADSRGRRDGESTAKECVSQAISDALSSLEVSSLAGNSLKVYPDILPHLGKRILLVSSAMELRSIKWTRPIVSSSLKLMQAGFRVWMLSGDEDHFTSPLSDSLPGHLRLISLEERGGYFDMCIFIGSDLKNIRPSTLWNHDFFIPHANSYHVPEPKELASVVNVLLAKVV